MASFNRVVIMGNLTRDPEYKQLPSGQANCKLGLASNRQYKNKQSGAMVQEVCFVDIDVWGAQAESCRQYLQKGRPVLVEGRLKFDTWKDMDGQTRSKHTLVADRVVFLGGPAASESVSQEMEIEEKLVPKNQAERDLLNQIDDIKARAAVAEKKPAARKATKKANNDVMDDSGDSFLKDDMDFKDEPPFADDLPF